MRYRALTIGLSLGLLSGSAAEANPQGAIVVNGQAAFSRPGANALDVTTSPGAILHWQDFSIGQQEITRFVQSSAASSVLNRVVGRNPSEILGQLVSNGRVFLINPNGIVFGPGARVDTAALVASTLNITDQDFLAGKLNFSAGDTAGAIRNYGYVKAGPKGEIVLIAPQIENHGTLEVKDGQLILAAGEKVKLASLDVDDVTFEVQAPGDSVLNLGKLIAEQGAIGVFAGTLRNGGQINADTLGKDAQGRIVLSATNDVTLDAGSTTSANGPNGGTVKIVSANGTTLVSGTVSATGTATDAGRGGRIEILGERVGLIGAANVDVSGTRGGGTALVGGDFHGANAAVENAQDTYVGADAKIAADAIADGNGGKVVVWADDTTRFHGALSARGGATGGDGGAAEISGKNALGMDGTVDTRAPHGAMGTVLFDPQNVFIGTGTGTDDAQIADGATVFADGGSADFTFGESTLELLNSNISIQTNGNFTINAGLAGGALSMPFSGKTFTVRAGGNILLNSGLTTNGGAISLTAGDSGATGFSTTGSISLNANVSTGGAGLTLANGSSGSTTITAASTVDLGGGTLSYGSAITLAGTIANAIMSGGATLTSSSGTLDNVTLANSISDSGLLNIRNTLTLGDLVTLNILGANQLHLHTNPSSIVTVNPGTTHSAVQIAGGAIYQDVTGTATIGQGVTIQGQGTVGACCSAAATLVNNGTIDANVAGATLSVTPTAFSSTGALTASAGTLNIAPGTPTTVWTNTGTLNVTASGAILDLGSSFTYNDIAGHVTHSNGTIQVSGTLDLQSNTADLSNGGTFGAQGFTKLAGGTITNGHLSGAGASFATSGTAIFDNVTIDSSMSFGTGFLYVRNTLTLADLVTFSILGASQLHLHTNPSSIVTANPGTTHSAVQIAGGAIYQDVTGTATIGQGVTVQGQGTVGACCSATATLVNNGTIDANVAGATLSVTPTAFSSTGALTASAGTLNIAPGTPTTVWTNTGTLNVTASGAILDLGSSFTYNDIAGHVTHSNGTIQVSGTLDLQSNTADLSNGGTFGAQGFTKLAGGTITNGHLSGAGASFATSGTAIFDNVTIDSSMSFGTGFLYVRNTLTLADLVTFSILGASQLHLHTNPSSIVTANPGTTHSAVQIAGGAIYQDVTGTATIGQGVTVQGQGTLGACCSATATLVNNGTIDANVAGATLSVTPTAFSSTGALTASAGTLNIAPGTPTTVWTNTGTLNVTASGAILDLGSSFTYNDIAGHVTHSNGTIQVSGTLDLQSNTADLSNGGTFGAQGFTKLAGGTITNGHLSGAGASFATSGTAIFDNVTIDSSMSFGTGFLYVRNTLTLADLVTFSILGASQLHLHTNPSSIVTANPGTTHSAVQIAGGAIYQDVTGTATIGQGITVQGQGTLGTCCSATMTLVNDGTIDANVAGTLFVTPTTLTNNGSLVASTGTLNVAPTTFSNAGSILVSGGTATIAPTAATDWALGGSITESAGSLTLGGTFSLDGLVTTGTFSRTNGSLTISGTMNLGSTVLDLANGGQLGTGSPVALSGTLRNGHVAGNGTALAVSGSTGTLDNVILDTDLTIAAASSPLSIKNTLTLGDLVTLDMGANQLRFHSNPSAIATLTPGVTHSTVQFANGTFYADVTGIDTIGQGVTVQGYGTIGPCCSALETLVNNGTISATAGTGFTINPDVFTNNGTVVSTAANITISPTTFNSAGALQIPGNTFTINPTNAWTNGAGSSITEVGGTLILGAVGGTAVETPTLLFGSGGSFSRTAGNVTLAGILDIGATPLDISSGGAFGTGGLTTLSGTLRNGELTGVTTLAASGSSATLDNVTLGGNLTIAAASNPLNIRNTLTLRDLVTLDMGANQLRFHSNPSAIATFTPGVTHSTVQFAGGAFYADVTGTDTIGQGVTVQGYGTIGPCCSAIQTLVNNGTISATASTGFTINPDVFTNNGTVVSTAANITISPTTFNSAGALQIPGNTFTINPTNAWTNGAGSSITEVGGTLVLGAVGGTAVETPTLLFGSGGSFSRTAGNVTLAGILDIGATPLDISSGGAFGTGGLTTLSGTLRNGELTGVTTLAASGSSATLDNVTLGSNLTIAAASNQLNIRNTLTLRDLVILDMGANQLRFHSNPSAIATFTPGVTHSTVQFANGTFYADVTGTDTIGLGITVQGYGTIGLCCSALETLVNNGTISSTVSGSTMFISPTTFTNTGSVLAAPGAFVSITPTNAFTNNGLIDFGAGGTVTTSNHSFTNAAGATLRGSGTINVGTGFTVTNNGTLSVGTGASGTTGMLSITGNLVLGATSVLDMEVGGLRRAQTPGYDSIAVTGTTSLGGTLNVSHLAGYAPVAGDSFLVVSSNGALSGTWSTLNTPVAYNAQYAAKDAIVQVGASAIPVNVWDTDSSGSWTTAANWSLAHVPLSSEIVLVDRGTANPVVTISTAGQSALRLYDEESLTLSAAGSLDLGGASYLGSGVTLQLFGGALGGAGAISFNGIGTWSSGNLGSTGAGSFIVNSGAELDVTTVGSTKNVTGGYTLATAGTGLVKLVASGFSLSGGNFTNAGTLNMAGDFGIAANGGTNLFTNAGSVLKSAGTVASVVGVPLADTNGTWTDSATGQIQLAGGGTGAGALTFAASTGALAFTGGTFALNDFTAAAADAVVVSGGAVSINGIATLPATSTLTVSAGSLGGAGTINLAGLATWSGGSLGIGAGTLDVITGGELDVTTAGAKNVSGGYTLATTGTGLVKLVSGSFNLAGGNFSNAGTFQIAGDFGIQPNGGTNLFTNTGSVLKSSGAIGSTINVPLADTNGTWTNAASGALQLFGGGTGSGTFTFASSTGSLAFSSGTFALNSFAAAAGNAVSINGGTVTIAGTATLPATSTLTLSSGNLGGTGTINLSGLGTWSGGNLGTGAGTFDVLTGGELDVTTAGAKNVNGGYTLATSGTGLVKLVSGSFNLGGGNFSNAGTFQMAGDFGIGANGGTNLFTNTGSVLKSAGTVGSAINVPLADTNGTWTNTASGALQLAGGGTGAGTLSFASSTGALAFSGGTFTLNSVTVAAGDGLTFNGATVNVNGTMSLPATTTLTLSSGTLGGTGAINLSGLGTWSGGNLGTGAGTFNVLTGGELDVTTAGAKNVNGGYTLATSGTGVLKLVSGSFNLSGGNVVNAGTIDFTGDWNIGANGGTNLLTNTSTMLKSGGASYSAIGVPIADTNGTWNPTSGAFGLDGGGTGSGTFGIAGNAVDFRAGTFTLNNVNDASNWWISGATVAVNGAASVPTGTGLKLTSGSLGGSGTITVAGLAVWDGGNFGSGAGSLVATGGGTLSLGTPAASKNVTGGYTLATTATGNLSVNADFNLAGGTVTNAGTLTLAGDFGILPAGGTNALTNSGTIVKASGTGTSAFGIPITSNTGIIRVQSGTLAATGSNAANAGLIDVWNGAVFQTTGNFGNGAAGTIRGSGTVNVGLGNTLTNSGLVSPETNLVNGTAATLHVTGNYTQTSTGTYAADLGGNTAGSYDVIAATGTVTLGGTITGTLVGGYTPANGDTLNVVTGATITPDFTTKTLPGTFTGAAAGVNYTLTYGTPAGCTGGTICFDNSAGDFLWTNVLNWSTDTLPIGTDDVFINLAGAIGVTLGSGAHAINSLHFASGDTLLFTSGSLAIAGALTGTGNVTVSGGALTANGTTTLTGALTVNSGSATLAGAGPNSITTLAVNGGTATFNSAHSLGGITLAGGSVGGTGALVLTGLGTWSGGSFGSGSGSFTVGSGGELDVTTAANGKQVGNYTLGTTGTGIVKLVSSGFALSNGTFANAGTLNLAGDYGVTSGGGTNTLANSGAVRKTAGSVASLIGVPVADTNGTWAVSGGQLQLAGGGTGTGTLSLATGAGTLAFTGGTFALGNLTAASNTALLVNTTTSVNNLTLLSGDALSVTGGALNVNGTGSLGSGTTFALAAGNLGGTGAITFQGLGTWSGGSFGSGSGSFTVGSSGELDVTTAANGKQVGNYTLGTTGTGIVKLVSSGFALSNGTFTNAGTLNLAGDYGVTSGGGTNTLANSGAVRKTAGSVASLIGVPVADTNGTWAVSGGQLQLAGGGTGTGTLSLATGAGTLAFTGGTFALGNLTAASNAALLVNTTTSVNNLTLLSGDALSVTGGALNVNGTGSLGSGTTFALAAGNLGGTGAITFQGLGTWSGGSFGSGSGSFTVGSGGELDVTTAANGKQVGNYTLGTTGTGIVKLVSSGFSLSNGTFANAGTLNLAGDYDVTSGGGTNTFANSGAVRKTAGSVASLIGVPVADTNGTWAVSGGQLQLAGGGTGTGTLSLATGAGTLAFTGGTFALGNLTAASNAALLVNATTSVNNLTLVSGDALSVTGGALNVNGTGSLGSGTTFALAAGNLGGTGAITFQGLGTWSGGSFGSGSGSFTVGSGGELDVTTAANGKQVGNYTLGTTGTGIVKLVSSGFALSNGTFANAGTLNLAGDYDLTSGGGTNGFTNTGALVKSAGPATSTIGIPMAANTGTITVSTGTLDVSGMLSANTTGTIDVASGATFKATGAFTNGVSAVGGGTLRGAGTIDFGAANTLTNHGTIAPGTGGGTAIGDLTINGNLVNTSTAAIAANIGGTSRGVSYDALDVTGTATLAGSVTVATSGGFVAANNDQFQIVTAAGGLGGTPGSTSLPPSYTMQSQGNNLVLTYFACAGTICFDNSAGDGLWSNALNWTGDVLPGVTDNVVVDLPGAPTVTLGSGTQTIASLFVNTGNVLDFTGGALTVNGAATVAGALNLNGGALTLRGTTQIASYVQTSGSADFGGASTVASFAESGGTFTGAGRLNVTSAFAHTGGTHDGSGTTVLGPAITFAPGASYVFGRDFQIDGALVQSGVDLDVATGRTLRLGGSWTWSAGAVTGGGTVVTTGTSALSGAGLKSFGAGSWQNRGTILWTGGTLDLAGVLDNQSGGVCQASLGSSADQMTGAGAFLNGAGATFVKTAGPQLDVLLPFTNAGTLVVNGTLRLARDFTNQGLVQLGTNGELLADPQSGGPAIVAFGNGVGGTLKGSGTIDVGSFANVTFENAGVIMPGNSPGTIVIVGNFTQLDTGKLVMDIGGYTAGTQFDLLSVSGTATLGGTLELELLGRFTPRPSDQFNLVGYAARSGDFATLVLPSGQSFTPDALPSFYRVSIAGVATAPADPTEQVLVMPEVLVPDSGAADTLGAVLGEAPIAYQPRRRGSSCQ